MPKWSIFWPFAKRKLTAADVLNERIRLESISTAIGASGVMLIAWVMYWLLPVAASDQMYMQEWLIAQLGVGLLWLGFIWLNYYQKLSCVRVCWPYFSTTVCSFYGVMWGMGWVVFVGDATTANALPAFVFTIVLSGVFTGGILATIFHLPSLLSFMMCCLMPLMISSFLNDGLFHHWLGISIIIYMLACIAFALNLHSFLMETLEQREEKALLAQALAQEKQRVELISQDKTRFLAAASHDLRQPLQSARLFQQSLHQVIQQEQYQQTQYLLNNLGSSLTSLHELLDGMLSVSQIDTGTIIVHRRPFALDTLLYRLFLHYEPVAQQVGIALRYVATQAWVDSDPLQLERMLRNLLENAIKHSRASKLLLGCRRCGQLLRIEVWDNGIGIPPNEQTNIFQEFYQLQNPERNRSQGVGLGLSIVKRLAVTLQHELTLRSKVHDYTVFALTVPLSQLSPDRLNLIPSTIPPTLKHNKQILVIEDDLTVLASLNSLLSLLGYEVITTANPIPLNLMKQYPDVHFIISDYQLSAGLNGVDVIQACRDLANRAIPALIITGLTDKDTKQHIESANIMLQYKPISSQTLQHLVQKVAI